MAWVSQKFIGYQTDYAQSMMDIRQRDPRAKVVTTQPMVQKLFAANPATVVELRRGLPYLVALFQNGYRYLIIDPQAYVSLTNSEKRFDLPLDSYLQYVVKHIPPVKEYNHFSDSLVKRFVWEHNENFLDSHRFLRESREEELGKLRIYDIAQVLGVLKKVLAQHEV